MANILFSTKYIDDEDYLTHVTVPSKTGVVVSNETIQIIDATESRDTLQIINEDGEPGW